MFNFKKRTSTQRLFPTIWRRFPTKSRIDVTGSLSRVTNTTDAGWLAGRSRRGQSSRVPLLDSVAPPEGEAAGGFRGCLTCIQPADQDEGSLAGWLNDGRREILVVTPGNCYNLTKKNVVDFLVFFRGGRIGWYGLSSLDEREKIQNLIDIYHFLLFFKFSSHKWFRFIFYATILYLFLVKRYFSLLAKIPTSSNASLITIFCYLNYKVSLPQKPFRVGWHFIKYVNTISFYLFQGNRNSISSQYRYKQFKLLCSKNNRRYYLLSSQMNENIYRRVNAWLSRCSNKSKSWFNRKLVWYANRTY